MSGALLREAAKALRERAEKATPGAWVHNPINGVHTIIGSCIATTHRHVEDARRADAAYIAVMHPMLGLALAELLETTADEIERRGVTARLKAPEVAAIAAARVVLGAVS